MGAEEVTEFICPEAALHGNPFHYCGVKGCGWMEETEEVTEIEIDGGEAISRIESVLREHRHKPVTNFDLAGMILDRVFGVEENE